MSSVFYPIGQTLYEADGRAYQIERRALTLGPFPDRAWFLARIVALAESRRLKKESLGQARDRLVGDMGNPVGEELRRCEGILGDRDRYKRYHDQPCHTFHRRYLDKET